MANYVLLERIELNASAASVTFSSIPQTGYTDLKVVASARTDKTGQVDDYVKIAFNGVSTNQSARILYGTGSAAGSTTDTAIYGPVDAAATSSTFSNTEFYIPNYTSTTAAKSVSIDSVLENNATAATSYLVAGLWNPGTQASITTIALTPYYGPNFVANSTFSLYGLAAVGTTPTVAPKASGGNIYTDGTYWYHTFLASGTFTPQTALSCDYLVVAGGGGGGGQGGGGGGAGGLRSTVTATGGGGSLESKLSVASSTAYTVTIGAGGTGGGATTDNGTAGGNSVFSTITATGGGQGGLGTTASNGKTGGSGGGGAGQISPATTGGTGTANQGYAGGASTITANYGAGGGGGAGAVGATGTGASSGAGGAGVAISALATATNSGVSNYYAGGGGGGLTYSGATAAAGGAGGGGAGGGAATGTVGTINTGSGGGAGGHFSGSGTAYAGANGGSGIVIIRYTIA